MPEQNSKPELPSSELVIPERKAVVQAGGWILTLSLVGLWIAAGQLWRSSQPVQLVTEAKYTVDINRASERDLLNLPEVGPSLAKKILSYRDQHGEFDSLSEFSEVPGIGPQTLKQLTPFLTFTSRSITATEHGSKGSNEGTTEDTTTETILTAHSRERIAP